MILPFRIFSPTGGVMSPTGRCLLLYPWRYSGPSLPRRSSPYLFNDSIYLVHLDLGFIFFFYSNRGPVLTCLLLKRSMRTIQIPLRFQSPCIISWGAVESILPCTQSELPSAQSRLTYQAATSARRSRRSLAHRQHGSTSIVHDE